MTRSNRVVNRLLIAVTGLLLIAAGGWVLAPTVAELFDARVRLPGYPRPTDQALWAAAVVLVVVAALAIAWALSRGRGRTSRLLQVTGADGSVTVDARVASDLLSDALAGEADVISVGSHAFTVRGESVLSLRVGVRRGADLEGVIRSVSDSVERLDQLMETRIPVLLRVASGVRASLAREQRAR